MIAEDRRNSFMNVLTSFLVSFFISGAISLFFIPKTINYISPQILDKYLVGLTGSIRPEGYETQRYMLFVILFALLFIGMYLLLSGNNKARNIMCSFYKRFYIKYIYTVSAFLMFIFIYSIYCYNSEWVGQQYVLKSNFLAENIWLVTLFSGLFVLIEWFFSVKYKKITNTVIYILTALLIVYTSYVCYTNFLSVHHFSAYYHSIFEVYNGATPLVDTKSIYGFYSYFYLPILNLTGIGLKKIYFLIAMISACSIIFFYVGIKNFVVKPFRALTVLAFLLFYTFYFHWGIVPELYPQYTPHRIIFPSLVFMMITFEAKCKLDNKKRLQFFAYSICVLALIWNFEAGLVCLVSYFMFQVYQLLCQPEYKNNVKLKKILLNTVYSIVVFLLYFTVVLLITYIRSGVLVPYSSLIAAQIEFFGNGFYMLPISEGAGPWILIIAVYTFGIAWALPHVKFLKGGGYNFENAIIFTLSVFGFANFVYFLGRSYDSNLIISSWAAYILICYFLFKMIDFIRKDTGNNSKRLKTAFIPITVTLIIFISGSASSILNVTQKDSFKKCINSESIVHQQAEENAAGAPYYISTNPEEITSPNFYYDADVLARYANSGCALLADDSAAVLTILEWKNAFVTNATMDWYYKEDLYKALDFLNNFDGEVVISITVYTEFMDNMPEEFQRALNKYKMIEQTETNFYLFFDNNLS